MNTVRIYIDENLDSYRLQGLMQTIREIPHVLDVEFSDREPHEVMVDYAENQNLPVKIIEVLRREGYHPDILSC